MTVCMVIFFCLKYHIYNIYTYVLYMRGSGNPSKDDIVMVCPVHFTSRLIGLAAARTVCRSFLPLEKRGRSSLLFTTHELNALNARLRDAAHDCLVLTEKVCGVVHLIVQSIFCIFFPMPWLRGYATLPMTAWSSRRRCVVSFTLWCRVSFVSFFSA